MLLKKQHLSAILLISITILSFFYIREYSDQFIKITEVGASGIAILVVLFLVSRALTVLPMIWFLSKHNASLSILEAIKLDLSTAYLNYLPLKAGLFAKGAYLKKVHNIRYTDYVSISLSLTIIQMLTVGVLGTGISIYVNSGVFISSIFIALSTACILVLNIPKKSLKSKFFEKNRISSLIADIVVGWQILTSDSRFLAIVLLLVCSATLTVGLRLVLCYSFLSLETGIAEILLISLASIPVRVIGIVPGAIGIREAVIGAFDLALGGNFQTGVIAASLDRLILLGCLFVLGPLATHSLSKKMLNQPENIG